VRLGHLGRVRQVEIDTTHYKGNYPHQVSIHGALVLQETADADLTSQSWHWPLLLEPQYLKADSLHRFEAELHDPGAISHVRINIHPDGGLNRVRLLGHPDLDR
jgi:allantoicase